MPARCHVAVRDGDIDFPRLGEIQWLGARGEADGNTCLSMHELSH